MHLRHRPRLIVIVLASVIAMSLSACARPATSVQKPAIPDPVTPIASTTDIGGFRQPTNLVAPDDGSNRLFVAERRGVIRVVRDGKLVSKPALDLTDRVGSSGSDDGLLGLAFPSDFAKKGYGYVYFTDKSGASQLTRVHVSASDRDVFDPTTLQSILGVKEAFDGNTGGQMAFGPDGFLYVGMGDGDSSGGSGNRAQDLSTFFGKILRIDTESTPDKTGYRVPPSNPFVDRPSARPEIWAYGLRNPWRFSFDSPTGDLWIGDRGQEQWEEVDHVPAGSKGGQNFGWPLYEGNDLSTATSKQPGFTWPVFAYTHREGKGVTGGYVYHGSAYPKMQGMYVFGDRDSGNIWTIRRNGKRYVERLARETLYKISTFGLDGTGELWVADYVSGRIHMVDDLSR
jgi:glucose/arabinose dehydrogenase